MAVYVSIYCAEQARRDALKHSANPHPDRYGTCYAQRMAGAWFCCCCGKPVKVVEP